VRVLVTDFRSKLAEEGVDVAVRIGPVQEASLVVRRLRRTRLVTVAAPSYLARRGTPRVPADLDRHDCAVLVSPQGRPRAWLFASGERSVRAALLVDHGPTLVDVALSGGWITQLFDYMAEELVRSGKLSLVLADEIAHGPDIHALCAPGRRAAARVRVAFEAFAESFAI
jgi:DNA-binding transcriptional LysR family regulator